MKKLIIVAHPLYHKSTHIRLIVEGIKKQSPDTTVHVLSASGMFNVAEEQKLLATHDVITFAFPVGGFNVPGTLKKYFDDVLTVGFAYSFQQQISDFKLRHKKFTYIASAGNVEQEYTTSGGNLDTVPNLHKGLQSLFAFIASGGPVDKKYLLEPVDYFLDPIVVYGASFSNQGVTKAVKQYLTTVGC